MDDDATAGKKKYTADSMKLDNHHQNNTSFSSRILFGISTDHWDIDRRRRHMYLRYPSETVFFVIFVSYKKKDGLAWIPTVHAYGYRRDGENSVFIL